MKITYWLLSSLTLIFLLASGLTSVVESGNPIQAKIYFNDIAEFRVLQSLYLDQISQDKNYIEIITDQTELNSINSLGFESIIIHDNLTSYYQSRLGDKEMGGYKTLAEVYQALDDLILLYPAIISQKISLGKTWENRDIWAVKISDNPALSESEPAVLFASAIHPREVITPEVLLNLMNHLCQNYGSDAEITSLVDNREIWIILIANPDGYFHNEDTFPDGGGLWRKNRRDNGDGTFGVDLNRNFGFGWGFDDIGSSPDPDAPTYRGIGPFSEVETQAIRDFAIAQDFVVTVFVHAYSNLVLWPWGFEETYTPDEPIFYAIGDSINSMNGYSPGPGWILYLTNGTTDDWFYGEQASKSKSFPFTIEVGSSSDGFWPDPARIPELVAENLEPCLLFCYVADHIYAMAPPLPPVVNLADTVGNQLYEVSWTHADSLNPAVLFELKELQDLQVIIDPITSADSWTNSGFQISTTRSASPPTSFYSGALNNSTLFFQSKYPYLVETDDSLKVNLFFDIETDWDYAYVEVSEDGIEFIPLPSWVTTDFDPHGNNRGNGITGSSLDNWVEAAFDLSDYVGGKIYFRFSYDTDQTVLGEGIYFDDIYPHIVFGSETSYQDLSDSSISFANRDQGDYWYAVRAGDNENQWSSFSALKQTFVKQSILCGDANNDSDINVADAVFIINYVFKDGAQPDSIPLGDANGDGVVNIGDGVFLINYVFKSGPTPQCL